MGTSLLFDAPQSGGGPAGKRSIIGREETAKLARFGNGGIKLMLLASENIGDAPTCFDATTGGAMFFGGRKDDTCDEMLLFMKLSDTFYSPEKLG